MSVRASGGKGHRTGLMEYRNPVGSANLCPLWQVTAPDQRLTGR
ncbi:hypothetical protein [Escherichia coli]|nr:hypothetical protein [Escherichia coli]